MNSKFNLIKITYSAMDYFDFIKSIRSKENITNSVFTLNSLDEVIINNNGKIFLGQHAAIVLCKDINNIFRLTFYLQDQSAAKEILDLLPKLKANIICDLIGKRNILEKQKEILESIGFELYAVFQRMICREIIVDDSIDLNGVELATENDVDEILEITYESFDPLTARMHSAKEITDFIKNKEVFVVRIKKKIAGFALFNSKDKKVALLDHIIVREEYRHKQIGSKLLYYKWKYNNKSNVYYLWVNEMCKVPIKHHEKHGFKNDGIYDYIFLLHK